MKTFPLLLFFLFTTSFLFAQDYQLEGKLVSAKDYAPIPYVNIGIKDRALGTVSDHLGAFELNVPEISDSIIFSAVGYESRTLAARDLVEETAAVELIEKAYAIEAIEVSAQRFDGEERRFGVKNETRGKSIAYGSGQLGTEIGAVIRFDRPTYIKSANFVLNHAKGDSMFFRLNIYAFRDKEVQEKLLRENIIIKAKQKKGLFTVDLREYNIVLDQEVLLSLEWIKADKDNGNIGITFDTKKPKRAQKPGGIYLRFSSNGDYQKFRFRPKAKVCFYFIGKQVKSKQ